MSTKPKKETKVYDLCFRVGNRLRYFKIDDTIPDGDLGDSKGFFYSAQNIEHMYSSLFLINRDTLDKLRKKYED